MKPNYPVAVGGGISQQAYEARTRIQRKGVTRMLRAAGIELERLRTVVDLGCRNGDTTLGVLETVPKARVIGVEEHREALLIARAKFGMLTGQERDEIKGLGEMIEEVTSGWLGNFYANAKATDLYRLSLVNSPLEHLPTVLGDEKADLIVGFQVLHWLNADETGLPTMEVLKAIYDSLAAGGIFLAGTSTAFIAIDPNEKIEGMTKAEYSIDNHPFVQMVYECIEDAVSAILGYAPQPVLAKPPLSKEGLEMRLRNAGFAMVSSDAFLVTSGREEVIDNVVRLRPEHQGRLNGVDNPDERKRIIEDAIRFANGICDQKVSGGEQDPRLVETNIYDAVPFVIATRLESEKARQAIQAA